MATVDEATDGRAARAAYHEAIRLLGCATRGTRGDYGSESEAMWRRVLARYSPGDRPIYARREIPPWDGALVADLRELCLDLGTRVAAASSSRSATARAGDPGKVQP